MWGFQFLSVVTASTSIVSTMKRRFSFFQLLHYSFMGLLIFHLFQFLSVVTRVSRQELEVDLCFSFFQLLHVNGSISQLADYIVLVSFTCYIKNAWVIIVLPNVLVSFSCYSTLAKSSATDSFWVLVSFSCYISPNSEVRAIQMFQFLSVVTRLRNTLIKIGKVLVSFSCYSSVIAPTSAFTEFQFLSVVTRNSISSKAWPKSFSFFQLLRPFPFLSISR